MFNNAAVGISIANKEGRITACNDKISELIGCPPNEILGRAITDFMVRDEVPENLELWQRIVRGDLPTYSRDRQYVRKDGAVMWANVSVSILERDATGQPVATMAIFQDLAKRKALEQNLHTTNDLLDSDRSRACRRACRVRRCSGGPSLRAGAPSQEKDGSLEWRLARGVAVRDERGTPTRLIGSHVDITDRKELERDLRHAKERLELALLGSRACAWDFELTNGAVEDSRATFTNLWELLGYEPAEHSPPLAGTLAILVHPEDQAPLALSIQSCLDGRGREWEQEFRARHKDGSVRWQLARGVVQRDDTSGRALRFTGSIVDITDRKLAERALRESEERFRLTFDNAAIGMVITNKEGRVTACNETVSELIGYPIEEIFGRSYMNFTVPEEAPEDLKRWQLFIRGDLPNYSRDRQCARKDGALVWTHASVSIVERDATGQPVSIVGIIQDLSERKSLEQNLHRTKDRLDLAVRSSHLSIFELDMPDGRLETCRPTLINFWEMLGCDPAEAPTELRAAAALVLTPDDVKRVPSAIKAHLSGAIPRFELEHQVRKKDGSLEWRLRAE